MQVGVAEFLEKVAFLKRTQEKVDALRANDSYVLRVVLQAAFDPNVKFLLPEGVPPYKPNDLPDLEGVLINEARKIVYFIEGFHPNLAQMKRESMYIEMLENVAPKDAELLVALKEKRLHVKGITRKHVALAFPDLMPHVTADVTTED